MKVLAIETATPMLSCCLWSDDTPVASFSLLAGGRHGELLMPAVDELCRRTGIGPGDLDALAVDRGPGLFTGLRVGLATAGALSAALDLPCAGTTSLEVLAHPHRRRRGLVAAVVDARRAEVYWSVYRSDGAALVAQAPPTVGAPVALAQELAEGGEPVLAVGDGAWRYRQLLESALVEVAGGEDRAPRAQVVAELGARAVADGRAAVRAPAPLYLRQADVRIGWDQLGGRVGASGAPVR